MSGEPCDDVDVLDRTIVELQAIFALEVRMRMRQRFRVPDDRELIFRDEYLGEQRAVSGKDFGDFLVWRKDGLPSYQLATVVDDIDFAISEVVRGEDLVKSTFRQLLLFEALGRTPPRFYHAPLLRDAKGERLAKRHDALALRTLRKQHVTPESILREFAREISNG